MEIQTNENKQDKKLIEVIMLKQLEFGEAAENEWKNKIKGTFKNIFA